MTPVAFFAKPVDTLTHDTLLWSLLIWKPSRRKALQGLSKRL